MGSNSFANKISSDEIYIYLDEQIKYVAKKHEIPEVLLQGILHSQKISKLNQEYITNSTNEEIMEYINDNNKDLKFSLSDIENVSSIVKLVNLISISLKIHFYKLEKFFSTNNFKIGENNLWIFASISFLFGSNTSLEILNHYSNMTSPRFLRHMLINEILLKNYLCNQKALWNYLTETIEPMAAMQKRKQLLNFFSTINYCKETSNEAP